ncbi:hypothetical protein [Streptomyces sp. NPDC059455]|uniref:hypothetical protein n=1 Tax=Streptomyces sp. NPDC059455 TaxID=3346837 RepID=UPI0036C9E8E2
MKYPVDDTTLTAWANLLGLTKDQSHEVLREVEEALRRGYEFRPLVLRHLTFEQTTADMAVDEFALMYLTFGLHRAGQDELADEVMGRALAPATTLRRPL